MTRNVGRRVGRLSQVLVAEFQGNLRRLRGFNCKKDPLILFIPREGGFFFKKVTSGGFFFFSKIVGKFGRRCHSG